MKRFLSFCTFYSILSFLLSCSLNSDLPITTKQVPVVEGYEGQPINIPVNYQSSVSSGRIKMSLQIEGFAPNNEEIDISSKGFKYKMQESVLDIATKFLPKVTLNQASEIKSSILYEIDALIKKRGVDYIRKQENQGIFLYLSAFQSIIRYHNDREFSNVQGNLTSTIYEGYLAGRTPYVAKEDIHYDVSQLKDYVKRNRHSEQISLEQADMLIDLLDNQEIKVVDLKTLDATIKNKVKEKSKTNPMFMTGRACGCCGSYDGECVFMSYLCYLHDQACEQCSPSWYCGFQCQKSPCFGWGSEPNQY